MSDENKEISNIRQSIEFINVDELDFFIKSVKSIDEKLSQSLVERLNKQLSLFIRNPVVLINDNKFNIHSLFDLYGTVKWQYKCLYENGLTDSIVKMFKKSGSVSYVFELFHHYISSILAYNEKRSYWNLAGTKMISDEKFLKLCCNDNDYFQEFTVMHLGLYSLLCLSHKTLLDEIYIKYNRLDIFPSDMGDDILLGLRLEFTTDELYGHYNGMQVSVHIGLENFCKGMIIQFFQYLYDADHFNKRFKGHSVHIHNDGKIKYDIDKTMEYLKKN